MLRVLSLLFVADLAGVMYFLFLFFVFGIAIFRCVADLIELVTDRFFSLCCLYRHANRTDMLTTTRYSIVSGSFCFGLFCGFAQRFDVHAFVLARSLDRCRRRLVYERELAICSRKVSATVVCQTSRRT